MAATRPAIAALSSSRTTSNAESLVSRTDRHREREPRMVLNSRMANVNEKASIRMDRPSTHMEIAKLSSSCGWSSGVDAVLDREYGPTHEEHDRNHEAPEVDLLATPEGMAGATGTLGGADPPQEHSLVAYVGNRVNPLGQHGRRPRQPCRYELGRGDESVADEGGDNCGS